jgi:HK97 family phage major capsid protein
MATAKEIGLKLEAKRGEMKRFLEARTTSAGLDFQGDDVQAFNDRNDELKSLTDQHNQLMAAENTARQNEDSLKSMRGVQRSGVYGGAGASFTSGGSLAGTNFSGGFGGSVKTLGELFLDSPEYKVHSGESPNVMRWAAQLPYDGVKAALSTSTGVVPYPAQQAGFVPFASRRPVMRDLMPVSETDSKFVLYIEQTTQDFGAAPVAEGASKPETSLGTTRRNVELEVIAHHIKVTNQALDFIPGVREMIDQQGVLGLQLAEEDQILGGTGSSPQLQGFLTKSGVQTQAVGADDKFTAFHNAMTKVMFSPGFANTTGGAINPLDWNRIVTTKDTQGRFIYGDPFAATQNARIWGVPLVVTPAITEGTALIGDFLMYSRLWISGGVRVLVGYVGDDLTKNQQTIVVEEYAALQISRPAAFCKITGLNG